MNISLSEQSSEGGEKETTTSVLVTVGSTRFDELVAAVDNLAFAAAVRDAGYDRLVIQAGEGDYMPHRMFPSNCKSCLLENGLLVEWFTYVPSLEPYFSSAGLVISHAGAGSIFETLRRGIPLITVPNRLLMDNHQKELAERLAADRLLVVASPERLTETVRSCDASSLRKYVSGDVCSMVDRIDEVCGAKGMD